MVIVGALPVLANRSRNFVNLADSRGSVSSVSKSLAANVTVGNLSKRTSLQETTPEMAGTSNVMYGLGH